MRALYRALKITYLHRTLPNQGSAIQLKLRTLLALRPNLTNYVFLPNSRPLLQQRAIRALIYTFITSAQARGRARQTVFQLTFRTRGSPRPLIKDPILFKYNCFSTLHALPRNGNNDILLQHCPRQIYGIFATSHTRLLSTSAPRTLQRLGRFLV